MMGRAHQRPALRPFRAGRVFRGPVAGLAAGFSLLAAPAIAQEAPQLTTDNLWTFRQLSAPEWSPNGQRIAFTVGEGETNSSAIFIADVDGTVRRLSLRRTDDPDRSGEPVMRTLLPEPWTPDGGTLLYLAGGDIRAADAGTGAARTLVDFGATSPGYTPQQYFNGPDPVLSPDGSKLAYIRESELWVLDLKGGGVRQLTSSHGEGWHNLQPRWSPDGTKILYTAQATDEQRRFRYTDFSGLIIGVRFTLIGYGRVRLGVIPATGGETTWLGPPEGERYSLRGGSGAYWSPDGNSVAINWLSLDHTAREIRIASPATGEVRTIWREEVDAWISPLAIWVAWSPDSRRLLFTSERTDWNHVYTIDARADDPRPLQITSGDFTVTSNQVYDRFEVTPVWSRGGRTILFPSNEAGTPERHLYEVPAAGGEWRRVTPLPGVNLSSTPSPDGSRVAYLHSNHTALPELYVQEVDSDDPRQLTSLAVPAWLEAYRLRTPEIVRFPSPDDGSAVTGRIFRPHGFDAARKYPAVVFVHGAGYAQSVFRGWMRLDQTAFNRYLAQAGYVVLDVDFRGSAGYGRKFRMDVFDRLGDVDVADVLGGVEFLRGLGYVDMDRIGIWGHSYGGFMVASALLRSPETFAVGVSSAPVTDWERFFYLAPGYNEEHFGFPWENPEGTRRGSPITYAANLVRPMLILSGIQDTMHLDAAALVNELLAHGRTTFEWIFYPDEAHGIQGPRARSDYYRRIAEYLDRYLREEPAER
ncbi:MAG: prolyl oligopeptidase family serine peptidase [Gemmatimonadetes bacterium]|nr:prolyl oligopeptidase family serine peptidase [Gemmatimonadota bacterium]